MLALPGEVQKVFRGQTDLLAMYEFRLRRASSSHREHHDIMTGIGEFSCHVTRYGRLAHPFPGAYEP